MRYYDPPEGWRWGFPKPYKPLPGETFEQTLTRDGYPARLMSLANMATRFWGTEEESVEVSPAQSGNDDGGNS